MIEKPLRLRDVPLSFLPAFEAAGRLGSFAAAAAELHITPSAISQQIRALEEAVGVALFERTGRTALLTPGGERYRAEVRQCLAELEGATERLRRGPRSSTLRLTTVSIAAHEFLMPRMAAFSARFPELTLTIETTSDLVDLKTRDYDAAIRFGDGWSDLTTHRLGRLEITPVCSPTLAREIHSFDDLGRHTWLDPNGDLLAQLRLYCAQRGIASLEGVRTWRVESCYEAMRAAEHGVGVAFGVFPLCTTWVESGRLAVPLVERLALPGEVSFVHRPTDGDRFPFADLAQWLRAQYRSMPALAPGRIAHAGSSLSAAAS
ncbi:MAG: LysR substrate-binding domain-containing protein [Polyangiales bacterium]